MKERNAMKFKPYKSLKFTKNGSRNKFIITLGSTQYEAIAGSLDWTVVIVYEIREVVMHYLFNSSLH